MEEEYEENKGGFSQPYNANRQYNNPRQNNYGGTQGMNYNRQWTPNKNSYENRYNSAPRQNYSQPGGQMNSNYNRNTFRNQDTRQSNYQPMNQRQNNYYGNMSNRYNDRYNMDYSQEDPQGQDFSGDYPEDHSDAMQQEAINEDVGQSQMQNEGGMKEEVGETSTNPPYKTSQNPSQSTQNMQPEPVTQTIPNQSSQRVPQTPQRSSIVSNNSQSDIQANFKIPQTPQRLNSLNNNSQNDFPANPRIPQTPQRSQQQYSQNQAGSYAVNKYPPSTPSRQTRESFEENQQSFPRPTQSVTSTNIPSTPMRQSTLQQPTYSQSSASNQKYIPGKDAPSNQLNNTTRSNPSVGPGMVKSGAQEQQQQQMQQKPVRPLGPSYDPDDEEEGEIEPNIKVEPTEITVKMEPESGYAKSEVGSNSKNEKRNSAPPEKSDSSSNAGSQFHLTRLNSNFSGITDSSQKSATSEERKESSLHPRNTTISTQALPAASSKLTPQINQPQREPRVGPQSQQITTVTVKPQDPSAISNDPNRYDKPINNANQNISKSNLTSATTRTSSITSTQPNEQMEEDWNNQGQTNTRFSSQTNKPTSFTARANMNVPNQAGYSSANRNSGNYQNAYGQEGEFDQAAPMNRVNNRGYAQFDQSQQQRPFRSNYQSQTPITRAFPSLNPFSNQPRYRPPRYDIEEIPQYSHPKQAPRQRFGQNQQGYGYNDNQQDNYNRYQPNYGRNQQNYQGTNRMQRPYQSSQNNYGQPQRFNQSNNYQNYQGTSTVGPKASPNPSDGDWSCHKCNNINFAKRINCNNCGFPKPPDEIMKTPVNKLGPPGLFREGDWQCFNCRNVNFRKREFCNKCGDQKPLEYIEREQELEQGGGYQHEQAGGYQNQQHYQVGGRQQQQPPRFQNMRPMRNNNSFMSEEDQNPQGEEEGYYQETEAYEEQPESGNFEEGEISASKRPFNPQMRQNAPPSQQFTNQNVTRPPSNQRSAQKFQANQGGQSQGGSFNNQQRPIMNQMNQGEAVETRSNQNMDRAPMQKTEERNQYQMDQKEEEDHQHEQLDSEQIDPRQQLYFGYNAGHEDYEENYEAYDPEGTMEDETRKMLQENLDNLMMNRQPQSQLVVRERSRSAEKENKVSENLFKPSYS